MVFVIHAEKSKFIPAKIYWFQPKYLDFIINSDKKKNNYEKYCIIPMKPKLTIREFTSFIDLLTSPFPGNRFALLYCRVL